MALFVLILIFVLTFILICCLMGNTKDNQGYGNSLNGNSSYSGNSSAGKSRTGGGFFPRNSSDKEYGRASWRQRQKEFQDGYKSGMEDSIYGNQYTYYSQRKGKSSAWKAGHTKGYEQYEDDF